jgi:hypothetical protein
MSWHIRCLNIWRAFLDALHPKQKNKGDTHDKIKQLNFGDGGGVHAELWFGRC